MKISKKMVVFILILGISLCQFKNVHINAQQEPENYLKAIGVEEEIINQMTDSQIAYIVERLMRLSDVSLFSGWAVVSEEVNLELYMKNMNGDKVQSVSINPWSTAETGYNFIIPSSIGLLSGLYEGHAYFQARRIEPSALNQIIIQYVHDASSSCDISYGVSIGPGSIGLNGNSSKLYSWTNSLDFTPVGE